MRRILLIALIAGALWFGLKDLGYRTLLSQGEPSAPPAADYTQAAAWAVFPETRPPGAWETPWGVDVFAILPLSGAPHRHGLVSPAHDLTRQRFGAHAASLASPLNDAAPVYAPFYRHASPVHSGKARAAYEETTRSDIAAAFGAYLQSHSQGRGFFVLVGPGMDEQASGALDLIMSDEALVERFGGVILLSGDDAEPSLADISCSPAMQSDCRLTADVTASRNGLTFLTPSLPRGTTNYRLSDADALAGALQTRAETLSVWLDETAPKPAEPFGGFDVEEVEVAPIRNPGDTDDGRTTETDD